MQIQMPMTQKYEYREKSGEHLKNNKNYKMQISGTHISVTVVTGITEAKTCVHLND